MRKLILLAALLATLLLAQYIPPGGGGSTVTVHTPLTLAGSSYFGPTYAATPPGLLATWSEVNAGSTTYADLTGGGISISAPSNGSANSLRMVSKSLPAVPYTVTFAYRHSFVLPNIYWFAGWRDSIGGGVVTCDIATNTSGQSTGYRVMQFTNPTTFSADAVALTGVTPSFSDIVFVRLADDGTNRTCSLSSDSVNFQSVYSATRTTFITPDSMVVGVDPAANAASLVLFSQQ